jgi:hypothetical protein
VTDLRKHESELQLARRLMVSVLITAPPDCALEIASAIAGEDDSGRARMLILNGPALLDPASWDRRNDAYIAADADLVIRDVDHLTLAEQAALLWQLETESADAPRRIIATSSASLFDRVQDGTFLDSLFYRLNVIHIVSDACPEAPATSSRPIIAT